MKAEDLKQILTDYMFDLYAARLVAKGKSEPERPGWWDPDWSDYLYNRWGYQFDIPSLPEPLTGLGEYNPAGEEFDDYSGPRFLLFQYGNQYFVKEGRNVSHVGIEFQYGRFFEVERISRTTMDWVEKE